MSTLEINVPESMGSGRCLHILGAALAHAVGALDALPELRRPFSDRDDMVALFFANVPEAMREIHLAVVERRTGHAPDMTDWKGAGS